MTILSAGMGEPDFANLIRNGSFVDHAEAWYPVQDNIALDFAAGESAEAASGSLSVDVVGPGFPQLIYRPGGIRRIPIGSLTTVDSEIKGKSASEWTVTFSVEFYDHPYAGNPIDDVTVDLAITGNDQWTTATVRDHAIASGATHAVIVARCERTVGTDPLYLDDVYVGIPDQDNPPYPGTKMPSLDVERLINGGAEDGILGWSEESGLVGTVPVIESVAPLSGAKSIKATTTGSSSGQGVITNQISGGIIAVAGETLRLTFKAKASAASNFLWYVSPQGGTMNDPVWTGTVTTSIQTFSSDIVIPAGVFNLGYLGFVTDWFGPGVALTFWLDDVSLARVDAP